MLAFPTACRLDPAAAMREMADVTASFENEPYDLVAEMPKFDWPTVVVSGGRDLTTPPSVAERIASLIPGATLVRLPTAGHSVLDTRERAAFAVIEAVRNGDIATLSAMAPALDALPGLGPVSACGVSDFGGRRRSNPHCPPPCRGGAAGYCFMNPIAV